MAKRKRTRQNDYYTSVQDSDNYSPVYDGLMKSEQFKALSPLAKHLYIACMVRRNDKQGQANLHMINKENGIEKGQAEYLSAERGFFTFPHKCLKEYGLRPHDCYNRLFPMLIERGFIEIVQCGKYARKENIYRLSAKWKKK